MDKSGKCSNKNKTQQNTAEFNTAQHTKYNTNSKTPSPQTGEGRRGGLLTMAIEMSNPWIVGTFGFAAGAVLAWIATEYRTRKNYRNIIALLVDSADDLAERGEVDKAMSIYDDILRHVKHPEPSIRGRIQFRQGICRYNQSFESGTESNLEESITAYNEALKIYASETHPVEHAQAQNRLGQAYFHLSQIKNEDRNLRNAILAYEESLKLSTPGSRSHAETQNNLGDAYRHLAAIRNEDVNLNKAILAYESALKFRTETDYPEEHAETQSKLGQAYATLALFTNHTKEEDKNKKALLDKATNAYGAALKIWNLESRPQQYALIEKKLGDAYRTSTETLNDAVSAYEESLKVWSLESLPEKYAEAQSSLGQTYALLADSGPETGGAGEVGKTGLLSIESPTTTELNRAIAAYNEALKVWTLETQPEKYAETQNNLGVAYRKLSERENREENMNRALKAYEEALKAKGKGNGEDAKSEIIEATATTAAKPAPQKKAEETKPAETSTVQAEGESKAAETPTDVKKAE